MWNPDLGTITSSGSSGSSMVTAEKWSSCPLKLTEKQKRAFDDFQGVVRIVNGTESPVKAANIAEGDLVPLAKEIDKEFNRIRDSFGKELNRAIIEDYSNSMKNFSKCRVVAKTVYRIIRHFRLHESHEVIMECYREEFCTESRLAILYKIEEAEKSRVKKVINKIEHRCQALIEDMNDPDVVDISVMDELSQLSKIYQMETDKELVIDGQNVQNVVMNLLNDKENSDD